MLARTALLFAAAAGGCVGHGLISRNPFRPGPIAPVTAATPQPQNAPLYSTAVYSPSQASGRTTPKPDTPTKPMPIISEPTPTVPAPADTTSEATADEAAFSQTDSPDSEPEGEVSRPRPKAAIRRRSQARTTTPKKQQPDERQFSSEEKSAISRSTRTFLARQMERRFIADGMVDSISSDEESSRGPVLRIHGDKCSQAFVNTLVARDDVFELRKAGWHRIVCHKSFFSWFDADL